MKQSSSSSILCFIAFFVINIINSYVSTSSLDYHSAQNIIRSFKVKPKLCVSKTGGKGVCMFHQPCIQNNGTTNTECRMLFLIGVCCESRQDGDSISVLYNKLQSKTGINDIEKTTEYSVTKRSTVRATTSSLSPSTTTVSSTATSSLSAVTNSQSTNFQTAAAVFEDQTGTPRSTTVSNDGELTTWQTVTDGTKDTTTVEVLSTFGMPAKSSTTDTSLPSTPMPGSWLFEKPPTEPSASSTAITWLYLNGTSSTAPTKKISTPVPTTKVSTHAPTKKVSKPIPTEKVSTSAPTKKTSTPEPSGIVTWRPKEPTTVSPDVLLPKTGPPPKEGGVRPFDVKYDTHGESSDSGETIIVNLDWKNPSKTESPPNTFIITEFTTPYQTPYEPSQETKAPSTLIEYSETVTTIGPTTKQVFQTPTTAAYTHATKAPVTALEIITKTPTAATTKTKTRTTTSTTTTTTTTKAPTTTTTTTKAPSTKTTTTSATTKPPTTTTSTTTTRAPTTATTTTTTRATTKAPTTTNTTTTRAPTTTTTTTKAPTTTSTTTTKAPTTTTSTTTTRAPTTTSTSTTRAPTTTSTTTTEVPTTTTSTTTRAPTTTAGSVSFEWGYRKNCGRRPLLERSGPHGRIVGGKASSFGQFPWQVLVISSKFFGLVVKNKCGGVLISRKHILTAAHCQPGLLETLKVVLGEHNLQSNSGALKPVTMNVRRMIVHRDYNALTFESDIGILEMDNDVQLMPHIYPICLPPPEVDYTGLVGIVSGWGKLSHGGRAPSLLQYVALPIISNKECQRWFLHAGRIKEIIPSFMCAGFKNGGQDSCEGDSGGPLMLQDASGKWTLGGIVSHGIKCAAPNLPGVYTRMTYYLEWILSITEI